MLRRRRLSALLSAALFLIAGTAEATGVHRCPHHDALPTDASTAATIHETGRHDTHAAPEAGEPAGHDDCTCRGACQPGGVATPSDLGAAASAVDATAHAPTGWWSPAPPRASLVPFALPFANGPPAR
jgi:hypothetical protein